MGDLTRNQASSPTHIVNDDETKVVTVETDGSGKNRLFTDTQISSVNVPLGKDPLPDTYFTISAAGAIGDTITVTIQPTANDTTSPDRDYPLFTHIYTLIAIDVGDEQILANNLVDSLNGDSLFEAQDLEAVAIIEDSKRAIVHITSISFSLNGEFNERPNTNDFTVVATGTTSIIISDGNKSIVSRAKETSLGRDPNNPHRLGIQAISGTVFIKSSDPEALIRERIQQVGGGGNINMAVNGGITPVVFEFAANPDGGADIIIDALKFFGNDTNIKVQAGKFLGQNAALTNGVLIELVRDGLVIFSEVLKNTVEVLALWSTSASLNKIIGASGGDYFETSFSLSDKNLAFVLTNGENDLVRVTIRDDLSSIELISMLVDGSEA